MSCPPSRALSCPVVSPSCPAGWDRCTLNRCPMPLCCPRQYQCCRPLPRIHWTRGGARGASSGSVERHGDAPFPNRLSAGCRLACRAQGSRDFGTPGLRLHDVGNTMILRSIAARSCTHPLPSQLHTFQQGKIADSLPRPPGTRTTPVPAVAPISLQRHRLHRGLDPEQPEADSIARGAAEHTSPAAGALY